MTITLLYRIIDDLKEIKLIKIDYLGTKGPETQRLIT